MDKGLATSLGEHLRRNGAGGRIVELPGEVVLDEWPRTNPPSKLDITDRVEALRQQFGTFILLGD